VFASKDLVFRKFRDDAEVEVTGWVEKSTRASQKKWIREFSDHCLLYGEIHD
jgi:hypothetical protein